MRAVVVHDPAPADGLEIIEVAAPEPGPGEIRIRVAAAGVNPVDIATRSGQVRSWGWITENDRLGLGWELSGTVSAVGAPAVDGPAHQFKVGDQVAALSWGTDRPLAAYAEEAVVAASAAALVPQSLPLVDAAAVPLNSLTALQGIAALGAPAERTLLVTGAAGSVGGYALTLANRLGWRVTALARESDRHFVLTAGASNLITEPVGTYDAVFDPAILPEHVLALVKDGGHYVGVTSAAVPDGGGRITAEAVVVAADGERLATLLADTAQGRLPVRIQAIVPLAEAAAAHKALEAGGVRGRYLLVP